MDFIAKNLVDHPAYNNCPEVKETVDKLVKAIDETYQVVGLISGRHQEKDNNGLKEQKNLMYTDLMNADLRGANFCGANLRNANLRNADLRGVDFTNADFRRTDFTNATFSSRMTSKSAREWLKGEK